jgi:hypothetical protein
MNDYYDHDGPNGHGDVGRFRKFFVVPNGDDERRGRLLRQVTFTETHDRGVIDARPTSADRMTPWLRTALANLLGLSRAALLFLLDAAGCIVVLLLLAVVWRWLT